MFPRCANSECSASFGSFREGAFFRFRRTDADLQAPSKSHSVEHAWLCAPCSEQFTLEYRENKTILVARVPVMPLVEVEVAPGAPARLHKRARPMRRRRSSSRRASAPPPSGNPFVVLAITPRGEIDRT